VKYILGIDIGGTNFRIGVVEQGEKRANFFKKVPVKDIFCSENPMKDIIKCLKEYCEFLKKNEIQISAVSIGFPATLDKERQMVLQAPNIPFMENMPVVNEISRELSIPVFIEKDVNLALCYDRKKYKVSDSEVLIGCYFGTGIGNAISINGKIFSGKNGTAGELGHIPVDGNYSLCGCGNRGCLENIAGGKYLSYLCQTEYLTTKIGELFHIHGNDPVLRKFVDRMAMAVATEVNILDPDHVIIGGGVPNMKGFPLEYLEEKIREHVRKPYPEQNLNIIFVEDEEDKCVVGAAIYAEEQLKY